MWIDIIVLIIILHTSACIPWVFVGDKPEGRARLVETMEGQLLRILYALSFASSTVTSPLMHARRLKTFLI